MHQLPAILVACGLRDYGIDPQVWGGDPSCDHAWGEQHEQHEQREAAISGKSRTSERFYGDDETRRFDGNHQKHAAGATCLRCGAWRGSLGLEPDHRQYVDHMVEVFRAVRRVLRKDGVLWLNLGDSYATGAGRVGSAPGGGAQGERWKGMAPSDKSTLRGNGHVGGGPKLHATPPVPVMRDDSKGRSHPKRADGNGVDRQHYVGPMTQPNRMPQTGLKPKDLCMMPARVALALQADGWWLRSCLPWCLSGGSWLYARTRGSIGPMMLKDLARLDPATVELWTGERWTRVTAWTKRLGRAGAVEIVLRSGERLGCTDDHVWPTERGELKTGELVRGDVIKTSRLPSGERQAEWLTPDAFWFAGLYLAEGSRSGDTIQISGHVKETGRLARLRALVLHYGGYVRAYNHQGNAQHIHIDSPALAAVLKTLIAGHVAHDKHLSPSAWAYRDWALKEIATGYLEGDGAFDRANDRWRLGFCRNYALERDLRALAARLGASITLTPAIAKNQTGKRFPSFRGEWRWVASEHASAKPRGEIVEIRKSRARQFWDVSVADEPHLFALASGVLTHNCKRNGMPESTADRPASSVEYVFMLTRSERYWYDGDAVKRAASPATNARVAQNVEAQAGSMRANGGAKTNGPMKAVVSRRKRAGPRSRIRANESFENATCSGVVDERNFRNSDLFFDSLDPAFGLISLADGTPLALDVSPHPFKEAHFATFPPRLVEPLIRAGCPAGGVVLDCFGGSGTVGVVADRMGRDAILIDLNPSYAAMAKARVERDSGMFADVKIE